MLKEVIDHGYRRARKYLTSFTVITQSLMDLKQFGEVGDVIKTNSAFKFLLEAPNYGAIREEGIIEYDEFTMRLLKGVRSNKPFYSEVFIDSPFGIGVGRLLVDPYSYYVYTSSAKEIAEIESLVREGGLSYDKAIRKMVETHRSHML
jgi:conjugal transfer ATP-binding protein TraC